MQVQLINKINNERISIESKCFPSVQYKDYVLIPESLWDKDVIWDEATQSVIEKPIDIEQLRLRGLSYYLTKADEFRKAKFSEIVNGRLMPSLESPIIEIIAEADLTLNNINEWLLIKAKAGDLKLAPFTRVLDIENNIKDEDFYCYVDEAEINRITTILTARIDAMTLLDKRVTKKIKTASNELILAVFSLMPEQLEQFSAAIMQNAESILQMTDEEFDLYLQNLLQGING